MKKSKIAAIVAGVVALGALCCIASSHISKDMLEANVEALSDAEYSAHGYCHRESNSCIYSCPFCNALLISVPDIQGPAYNVSGVCPSCHNRL